MDPVFALTLSGGVEKIGAYAGLAAIPGLAILALLYFSQARELRRLREWAGRAPERAQEIQHQAAAAAQARPTVTRRPPPRPPAARPAPPAARPPAQARPAPAAGAAAAGAAAGAAAAAAAATAMGTPAAAPPAAATPAAQAAAPPTAPAVAAAATGVPAPAAAGAPEPAGAPDDDDTDGPNAGTGETVAEPDGPGSDDLEATQAFPSPLVDAHHEDDEADDDEDDDEDEDDYEDDDYEDESFEMPKVAPRGEARPGQQAAVAALRADTASRAAPRPAPARPGHGGVRGGPPRQGGPDDEGGGGRGRTIALIVGGVAIAAVAIFLLVTQVFGGSDSSSSTTAASKPTTAAKTPTATTGGGTATPVNRGQTTVTVLNGTTTPGLAAQIADQLQKAGFARGATTNAADQQVAQTTVVYAPGEERAAREVAKLLGVAKVAPIDANTQAIAGADSAVVVTVGSDRAQ